MGHRRGRSLPEAVRGVRSIGALCMALILAAGCTTSSGDTDPPTPSRGETTTTLGSTGLVVTAWNDAVINTVCLDFDERYEAVASGFTPVADALTGSFDEDVPLVVDDDTCDAQISATVMGRPLSASYVPGGTLFTGAEMDVTLTLSSPGRDPLVAAFVRTAPPPDSLVRWEGSDLPATPEAAPFWDTIQDDVCASFAEWFAGTRPRSNVSELLTNVMKGEGWTYGESCGGYVP